MSNIFVYMKDGEIKKFPHEGRPGGGYTKTLKLENGFAVIEDEWYNRTIIPSADIKEIKEEPHQGRW